jgi:hypothetical protein
VEQGNDPEEVPDLIGGYVLAAFAENNSHLAFIVKVSNPLWKGNRIIRAGNFC